MNQKQLLVPNLLRPRVNTNAACCKVSPFFDADERQNSSEMCSIASKLRFDACPTTKPWCAEKTTCRRCTPKPQATPHATMNSLVSMTGLQPQKSALRSHSTARGRSSGAASSQKRCGRPAPPHTTAHWDQRGSCTSMRTELTTNQS